LNLALHSAYQSPSPVSLVELMQATNQAMVVCTRPGQGKPGSLVRAGFNSCRQPITPIANEKHEEEVNIRLYYN
jgi:hypothetical protein